MCIRRFLVHEWEEVLPHSCCYIITRRYKTSTIEKEHCVRHGGVEGVVRERLHRRMLKWHNTHVRGWEDVYVWDEWQKLIQDFTEK